AWVKWLPHSRDASATVSMTSDVAGLEILLEQVARPRLEQMRRMSGRESERAAVPADQVLLVVDGYRPDAPVGRIGLLHEVVAMAQELRIAVLCLVDAPADAPAGVAGV